MRCIPIILLFLYNTVFQNPGFRDKEGGNVLTFSRTVCVLCLLRILFSAATFLNSTFSPLSFFPLSRTVRIVAGFGLLSNASAAVAVTFDATLIEAIISIISSAFFLNPPKDTCELWASRQIRSCICGCLINVAITHLFR